MFRASLFYIYSIYKYINLPLCFTCLAVCLWFDQDMSIVRGVVSVFPAVGATPPLPPPYLDFNARHHSSVLGKERERGRGEGLTQASTMAPTSTLHSLALLGYISITVLLPSLKGGGGHGEAARCAITRAFHAQLNMRTHAALIEIHLGGLEAVRHCIEPAAAVGRAAVGQVPALQVAVAVRRGGGCVQLCVWC